MSHRLNIAIAQINMMVGDVDQNARKIEDYCLRARDEFKADLIVFPELSLSGYPPEDLLLRQSFIQWCESALYSLLPRVKGIDVVLGLPWRDAEGLRNAAVVLHDHLARRRGRVVAPRSSGEEAVLHE